MNEPFTLKGVQEIKRECTPETHMYRSPSCNNLPIVECIFKNSTAIYGPLEICDLEPNQFLKSPSDLEMWFLHLAAYQNNLERISF